MQINGVDIDYNLYDTTQFKKFELGVTHVKNEVENIKKQNQLMEYERGEACCKLIVNLITDLFGEEKCSEIITNKNDMMLCAMVFADLIEVSNDYVTENNKKLEKYNIKRLNGKHSNR